MTIFYIKTKKLLDLREEANKHFDEKNVNQFLNVARRTVNHLEGLPVNHRFHLPSQLMFVSPPSPFSGIFNEVLHKSFAKAYDVAGKQYAAKNNNSGRAISGPRGVGKSTGLILCTILAPLLLPRNIISVYVDYQTYANEPLASPFELLKQAILHAGLWNTVWKEEDPPTDMNALLGALNLAGYSFMFSGDEIKNVYHNSKVWTEFHNLASSMESSIFLADSSSKLRTLIEAQDEKTIRQWGFKAVQPSLNGTKISMVQFRPFSTVEEYNAYFKCRPGIFNGDLRIQQIQGYHLLTAGRMRSISMYAHGGDCSKHDYEFLLPNSNSLDYYILCKLKTLQDEKLQSSGKSFDPFDLACISEPALVQHISEFYSGKKEYEQCSIDSALVELEERNIIVKKHDGYTFATPFHFIKLSSWRPTVFVSHCCADYSDTRFQAMLKHLTDAGVSLILCEENTEKWKMATIGLDCWMKKQVEPNTVDMHKKYVMVVLSEGYIASVNKKGGCFTELDDILKNMSSSKYANNILLVMLSDHSTLTNSDCQEIKALLQHNKYIYSVNEVAGITHYLTQ